MTAPTIIRTTTIGKIRITEHRDVGRTYFVVADVRYTHTIIVSSLKDLRNAVEEAWDRHINGEGQP